MEISVSAFLLAMAHLGPLKYKAFIDHSSFACAASTGASLMMGTSVILKQAEPATSSPSCRVIGGQEHRS